MTTITRRAALAASVTLPLLPAAALAAPVSLPLLPVSALAAPVALPMASYATPADPAVEAYREWQEAHRTFLIAIKTREDDDPVVDAADDADNAAAVKLAETVPTTIAGLVAQIKFVPYCFGQIDSDDYDYTNPENYGFHNWGCDDREAALCRSMQAGAEQMAGVSS